MLEYTPIPFSEDAPSFRIWIARRISKLNRATAAALSHSPSCTREFKNGPTSTSVPFFIHPQSCKARFSLHLNSEYQFAYPTHSNYVCYFPPFLKRETFLHYFIIHYFLKYILENESVLHRNISTLEFKYSTSQSQFYDSINIKYVTKQNIFYMLLRTSFPSYQKRAIGIS